MKEKIPTKIVINDKSDYTFSDIPNGAFFKIFRNDLYYGNVIVTIE